MDALATNRATFEAVYDERRTALRYPHDFVIRFHAYWLREHIPAGRVLDFGCGSGNNLVLFRDQGYEVVGTDIAEAVRPLFNETLPDAELHILEPRPERLPFDDDTFDVVLSNQAIYFLADPAAIRHVTAEFARILRPGGVVFATMMGPQSYWIAEYGTEIAPDTYRIDIPGGRLGERHHVAYVTRDRPHLRSLFPDFTEITIGWFSQSMFDVTSTFHWIYVGRL